MSFLLLTPAQVETLHDLIFNPGELPGRAQDKSLDGALARVDNRLVYGMIEDVFERRGMTILRNARATSCHPDDDGVTVGLLDGQEVRGSHVLFTVGQVPAGRDLGLEGADVEVQDWGAIDVDGVGRT